MGVTVMVRTVGAETVTTVVPFTVGFATLVARIVLVPAVTAVTVPLVLTVATAVLLLFHVTDDDTPASASTVAVSARVALMSSEGLLGAMVTDRTTGKLTVTAMVAVTDAVATDVTVIVAVPGATPVIVPSLATVAIVVALERSVVAVDAPASATTVMVGFVLAPTNTDSVAGAETLRAMGVTVTVVDPLTPPAVAVMEAVPPPTAVTVALDPEPTTVATAGLAELQLILAVALDGVMPALSEPLAPIPVSVRAPGDTATDVTLGGGGVPPPPSPPPPHAPTNKTRRAVRNADGVIDIGFVERRGGRGIAELN